MLYSPEMLDVEFSWMTSTLQQNRPEACHCVCCHGYLCQSLASQPSCRRVVYLHVKEVSGHWCCWRQESPLSLQWGCHGRRVQLVASRGKNAGSTWPEKWWCFDEGCRLREWCHWSWEGIPLSVVERPWRGRTGTMRCYAETRRGRACLSIEFLAGKGHAKHMVRKRERVREREEGEGGHIQLTITLSCFESRTYWVILPAVFIVHKRIFVNKSDREASVQSSLAEQGGPAVPDRLSSEPCHEVRNQPTSPRLWAADWSEPWKATWHEGKFFLQFHLLMNVFQELESSETNSGWELAFKWNSSLESITWAHCLRRDVADSRIVLTTPDAARRVDQSSGWWWDSDGRADRLIEVDYQRRCVEAY